MVKKKTSIKISNIALIVVLILIFAYFLLYGIRDVTVCNNIKTDELKEYQGNVELKTENRTRNTVYFIKLDNGDTVRVNPDLLESGADLEQYEQLSIRYSEPKYGLKGAYTAVEICAGDNDTILLDDQASYEEAKGGAFIGFIFSGVIALILIGVSVGTVMIQKSNRGKKKNVRTKH